MDNKGGTQQPARSRRLRRRSALDRRSAGEPRARNPMRHGERASERKLRTFLGPRHGGWLDAQPVRSSESRTKERSTPDLDAIAHELEAPRSSLARVVSCRVSVRQRGSSRHTARCSGLFALRRRRARVGLRPRFGHTMQRQHALSADRARTRRAQLGSSRVVQSDVPPTGRLPSVGFSANTLRRSRRFAVRPADVRRGVCRRRTVSGRLAVSRQRVVRARGALADAMEATARVSQRSRARGAIR